MLKIRPLFNKYFKNPPTKTQTKTKKIRADHFIKYENRSNNFPIQ